MRDGKDPWGVDTSGFFFVSAYASGLVPVLGPDTPVNRLKWSNGGREKILRYEPNMAQC